jgi:hypothetical protein
MKYTIDIDALKSCLDLLTTTSYTHETNKEDYVSLEKVKTMIDKFPKERAEELYGGSC